MRGLAVVAGISALCLVCFGLGIWAGVLLADLRKRTEFCNDTSSPLYIHDNAARAQSCDTPRSSSEIQ